MVRIAVCDDEKGTVSELERSLADIFAGRKKAHKTDRFYSANELCRAIKSGKRYDLIFLDIMFAENEMSGVELGRFLREQGDNHVFIVYISWEQQEARPLIKTDPLDFLIKPLTREKIGEAVQAYFRRAVPAALFTWKRGRTAYSAPIKDIAYFESRKREVLICRADGTKDAFYGTLKELYEGQLKNFDFLFSHASYLVNYDYVTSAEYNYLHLSVGESLPISQNRRNEIRDRYFAISEQRRGV